MPKGEPLNPAVQQLVADVASQAGLVLSNVGLVEDLRASLRRLVTAQDETRRRRHSVIFGVGGESAATA